MSRHFASPTRDATAQLQARGSSSMTPPAFQLQSSKMESKESSEAIQRAADPETCEELLVEILKTITVLQKRYWDLINDPLGLPPFGPMSVDGHQQQFRGWQRRLRRLLDLWNSKGCGNNFELPPRAWEWANKPVPSPSPQPNTNYQPKDGTEITPQDVVDAAGKTALVVGTGYLVYRAVRMLPSLLPPLWWTIPANAAMP